MEPTTEKLQKKRRSNSDGKEMVESKWRIVRKRLTEMTRSAFHFMEEKDIGTFGQHSTYDCFHVLLIDVYILIALLKTFSKGISLGSNI